jgi:hypothetical protein
MQNGLIVNYKIDDQPAIDLFSQLADITSLANLSASQINARMMIFISSVRSCQCAPQPEIDDPGDMMLQSAE